MTRRLVAAFVAVVLLVLLAHDLPLASYLRDTEKERIVTALERDAFVLAGRSEESLHAPGEGKDPTAAAATVTELARDYQAQSGARVVIVDASGVAIVTSDDDPGAVGSSYLSRPEFSAALTGTVSSGSRYSQTLSEQLLYVAVPVLSGDEVLGAVRLTYPEAVVDAAAGQKLVGLGAVGLTSALVAALIAVLVARSVTARVRRLRETTEAFAAGDRAVRAEETGGAPELRALGHSFNSMAARLDALIDQQRAFAADASHQLRTPLTALRLRLERARDLAATDPAAAQQRLDAAVGELDRLDELVEGLLVLSRAEPDPAPAETVDLTAVVRERVEQWAALAQESGRAVRAGALAHPALVRSSPRALEQIIDNLVDNALAVTPEGAAVEVATRHERGAIELHVLDRGPGLMPEARERAFERFWRGEATHPGTGLGLAIVAQLARAADAEARLDAREGGGLDAVVRFPARRSVDAP
ncbi:MAG: HAMP domain-containing protein [Actinomycetales bacterium]|nr:HAMP domain-containing protein [Actinomycetales bacterium]